MSSGAVLLLVLSLPLPVQAPRDSFKLHYEKAEALRRKGDLSAAEAEYTAILSETYYTLGKILLAQSNYAESVTALKAATAYHSDSDEVLIDPNKSGGDQTTSASIEDVSEDGERMRVGVQRLHDVLTLRETADPESAVRIADAVSRMRSKQSNKSQSRSRHSTKCTRVSAVRCLSRMVGLYRQTTVTRCWSMRRCVRAALAS